MTLLWAEEGVVDFYQVLCTASGGKKELKVLPRVLGAPGGQLQHHTRCRWFSR